MNEGEQEVKESGRALSSESSLMKEDMTSAEVVSFFNKHTKMVVNEGNVLSGARTMLSPPIFFKTFFHNPKDDEILSLFEILHPYPQGSSGLEISIDDFNTFDSSQVTSFLSKEFCRPRQLELDLNQNLPAGKILAVISARDLELYFKASSKHGAKALHMYLTELKPRKDRPSPEDIADWSKAFTVKYKDPQNMVENFLAYIRACSDSFSRRPGKYFSPYISLVQSSGYGKSRLLREVSRHVRVMYVSMMDSSDSGYPRPTDDAKKAMFADLDSGNPAKLLAGRIRQCHVRATTMLPLPGVCDALGEARFPSEQCSGVWAFEEDDDLERKCSEELVLLVVDEARSLLAQTLSDRTLFQHLRTGLRLAATDMQVQIFGVLMDTSLQIQNFLPAHDDIKYAHSARATCGMSESDEKTLELFQPFFVRNSFDAHLPKASHDLTGLAASYNFLKTGRPLLSCIEVRGPDLEKCSDKELNFLSLKLKGGSKEWTVEGSLSHMLCRVAASLSPQHPFASQLVAGNMATLLTSDFERQSVLTSYVAEAKLAIAAAEQWSREDIFLGHILPALNRSLATGAISMGHRGELTAQVILLWAFDVTCRLNSQQPGQCVNLKDVLIQLLPSDVDDKFVDECIPAKLRDAKIACCQFINLMQKPRPEIFLQLAERHVGAALKEGQRGADLLVPIMYPEASLMVQVKNYSDEDNPGSFSERACGKLLPSFSFKEDFTGENKDTTLKHYDDLCVRVLMQLGSHTPTCTCNAIGTEPQSQAHPIQLFGINSRCLSEKLRAALQTFVNGRTDLTTMLSESLLKTNETNSPFPDQVESIGCAWPFVFREWEDMTVRELTQACKQKGLSATGNRQQLINTLRSSSEKRSLL